MAPIEPPATAWEFPPATAADEHGVVGHGADLEPGTLLTAYRSGLFPMPRQRGGPMAWWSPNPRGTLPVDGLRVSRSLRKSCRRYEVRIDTAFDDVIEACADPSRPHAWITEAVRAAYTRLHELGWVHSVEAWLTDVDGPPQLAGGLYGIAIGGLFAGESMFHRETDASKVALVRLVELFREAGAEGRVIDVQWLTPHLESLGAVEVPRRRYLELLQRALTLPLPPQFAGPARRA
ncbi:MAG: leucyl/phenylalanyl-tRNA--protein transferase [Acidimicrobiales bacterium]